MIKYFFYAVVLTFIFSGCSSKQYYSPKDTSDNNTIKTKELSSTISDYTPNGATLENSKFVSNDGESKIVLPEGFLFLNKTDNTILASNEKQELYINTNDKNQTIKFEKNIISASKKNNLLALGFSDNSIALYDTNSKKTVFKEYFKASQINDIKIASAVFLDSIVLFPTLDGKVVIVDTIKNSIVKNINIDPRSDINNIIYLKNQGDTLIAATSKKVFAFNNKNINIKDLDIKYVTTSEKNIFVATLDGQIIKYDFNLLKLNSKKFKFAKFFTLLHSNKKVFALESQEYLIELDENLENTKVYDFDFDNEEKVVSINNKLYFEDQYIELK